jgi:hypothetical protein
MLAEPFLRFKGYIVSGNAPFFAGFDTLNDYQPSALSGAGGLITPIVIHRIYSALPLRKRPSLLGNHRHPSNPSFKYAKYIRLSDSLDLKLRSDTRV